MSLPYDLDKVRNSPDMFFADVSYDSVVSYLFGIDKGCNGQFLKGFHEWIVPIVDGGNNLWWPEIVLRISFPQSIDPRSELSKESSSKIAIDCLFQCLEDFLAEKEKDQGLLYINQRYKEWLRSQDWYSPSHPGWIDDDLSKM